MFGFLPISILFVDLTELSDWVSNQQVIRLPKPTFFRVEKHIKEDENKKMGGVCGREHALSAFISAPPNPIRIKLSIFNLLTTGYHVCLV